MLNIQVLSKVIKEYPPKISFLKFCTLMQMNDAMGRRSLYGPSEWFPQWPTGAANGPDIIAVQQSLDAQFTNALVHRINPIELQDNYKISCDSNFDITTAQKNLETLVEKYMREQHELGRLKSQNLDEDIAHVLHGIRQKTSAKALATFLVAEVLGSLTYYESKESKSSSSPISQIRLQSILPPPIDLIGRNQELNELSSLLEGYGRVMLYGPHGSGKTAILQALCHQLRPKYHILYVPVKLSLMNTIADDNLLPIAEKPNHFLSDHEWCERKLQIIEQSLNSFTLIIFDGVSDTDELKKRVCRLNKCKLIISGITRFKDDQALCLTPYHLSDLDESTSLGLFNRYYENNLTAEDHTALQSLLPRNALGTVTLARFIRYIGRTPHQYAQTMPLLRNRHFQEYIASESDSIKKTYHAMDTLFRQADLSASEIGVLKVLSMASTLGGISQTLLTRLLPGFDELPSILTSLEALGFLQREKQLVSLSPLMCQILSLHHNLTLDDHVVSLFAEELIRRLRNAYDLEKDEQREYITPALMLYKAFSVDINRFRLYNTLASFFWVAQKKDYAEEIQMKLTAAFNASSPLSAEAGETALMHGIFLQTSGNLLKAKERFASSTQILANRYATSLSYLAQLTDDRAIASEMFQESVSLRGKYRLKQSAPISYASALHHYAKFLADGDGSDELEKAYLLEQEADAVFAAHQGPNGVNASSTHLLLGWIRWKKANACQDREERMAAIQEMELAKKIRLDFRPELHPWNEEPYQKLAFAYEQVDDIEHAITHLEKLFRVQELKYGPSGKQTLETQRHLQHLQNKKALR